MEIFQSTLSCDRFSNLPCGVAKTILTYMPLRDAVRTSILSRKWRYVWTKLPQYVLDENLWNNVAVEYSAKSTVLKILFQLLLCHDGPIIKFTLSNPVLTSCPELDNLIFFLAKSQIEDLTLEMVKDCYLLPCSIFSCQTLRHLRLSSCSLRNFPSIRFGLLTSLKLIKVIISSETLASLISGSPLLGMLEIDSISEVDIRIDAPNLKTIILRGLIKSINFKRVSVLFSVSIHINSLNPKVDFVCLKSNVVKFFDCLLALKILQLSYHVVQSFGGEIQKRLPMSLVHLVHLKLSNISFNEMDELSFILCLIRSSPILKYIEILVFDPPNSTSEETASYMEGEDYSDICLSELREVKLSNETGTKPELEFVRLLLAKSPSLSKFQIKPKEADVDERYKVLKEVTKFQRISRNAEIIYDE